MAWTNPSGNPPTGGGAIQVDSVGKVGIGTAAPLQKFHVAAGDLQLDNNRFIRLRNAAGNGDGAFILTGGNDLEWRDPVSGSMTFTILDGGNVGIGAAPTEKLDVSNGEIRFGYAERLGGFEHTGAANNELRLFSNIHYDTDSKFKLRDTAKTGALLIMGDSGLTYTYRPANSLSFSAIDSFFTISPSGNVGIGTNSPADKLVVVGSGSSAGSVAFPTTGDEIKFLKNGVNYISTPGLTASLIFKTGGNDRAAITSAGNLDLYLNKIINLAAPTAASDAVTKKYVDDKITAPNNTRLWGEGRPNVDVKGNNCTNGTIKFDISSKSTHWGSAASVCKAGWWVCTVAERGDAACGASGAASKDCGGVNTNNSKIWVADSSAGVGEMSAYVVDINGGSPGTINSCETHGVWCCIYK